MTARQKIVQGRALARWRVWADSHPSLVLDPILAFDPPGAARVWAACQEAWDTNESILVWVRPSAWTDEGAEALRVTARMALTFEVVKP